MATPENALRLDDDGTFRGEPFHNELVREHYRQIGQLLNICEAGNWTVGVPGVGPTKRTRQLAGAYDGPLDEFIKMSLVEVSTNVLELYCDDLESIPPSSDVSSSLYIRQLSFLERFAFAALLTIVVGAFSYWAGGGFEFTPAHTWFFSLGIAGAVCLLLIALCLEPQRRYSFHALLCREIMRRKGLDQPNSGGLRIMPVGTKPLPK